VEHVRLREAVDADLVLAAELGHDPVPASSRRSPLHDRDRARKSSLTPSRYRVRATSSSRWTARGSGWAGWRSSRVTGTPEVGEQEGRGAADRAGADDDDGDRGCWSWRRGCWSVPWWFFLSAVGAVRRPVRQRADGEGNPARASRTRSGSAPVTVMTGRPCSWAAVTCAPGRPASARTRCGAGGGVGGQRGLVGLADGGDRDRLDGVDPLRAGGGLADGGAGPGQQFGSSNRPGSAGTT
jgi:hypothetical protein